VTLPEVIPLVGLRWDDLLFLTLGGIMLAAGILVVTMRDIIRCGLAMIVCFAALAGIYVMAGAAVVAAAQVLVYIGAISVLVLFAIMLTQTKAGPSRLVFHAQAGWSGVASIVLAIILVVAVSATAWPEGSGLLVTETRALAQTLFGEFILPFEIVSVLLLAAVIGGVFLAKREDPEGSD
jgi:NADH-quinone oxidoreductase subunit J